MSSALLVIDVQQEALLGCPGGDEVVRRINELSRRAADGGVPVVFIQHEDEDELVKGTSGWELAADLERPDGSLLVPKTYRDAFEATELGSLLERLGARHLVVTGVHSDYCVQTTALSALIRGFDLTLVKDGHAARSTPGDHDPALSPHAIQTFINARFSTLRYPGRRIEVLPAAEIRFAPAAPRSSAAADRHASARPAPQT
jgi:nicotinamidase-related amidase